MDTEFQSQPCLTIHYTHDVTLEGSSCCEMLDSVQTHLILVWKVVEGLATFVTTHDPNTGCGNHYVVNEFQSQPCLTIYHTYDETLEGSSCCEMLESVPTHLILVWKVVVGLATFVPTHDSKTGCGDHFWQSIPFSTLPNHSLYLWWDIERVKLLSIAWTGTNTLNLGVESRGVELKLAPPVTHKSGCCDEHA